MQVIHIAGHPGSGKTTLGLKLQSLLPHTKVIDIDTVIQRIPEERALLRSLTNPEAYRVAWSIIWDTKLKKVIDSARQEGVKALILTGCLEHFRTKDGIMSVYELKPDIGYYLHLPLSVLLKQLYEREMNQIDWEKLAAGTISITSSKEVIERENMLRTWYTDHGYHVISADDVGKRIKTILG